MRKIALIALAGLLFTTGMLEAHFHKADAASVAEVKGGPVSPLPMPEIDLHKESTPKVEPVVEITPLVNEVNEEDIYWLAKAMYCENGQSSDEALLLTGIVIVKRTLHKDCPDTIREVITDNRFGIQYACYYNGAWGKKEPDERSLSLVRRILEEDLQKNYPDGLIFQSEFKQGSAVYKHIGNQYFCIA